jgi:hypothetical protein
MVRMCAAAVALTFALAWATADEARFPVVFPLEAAYASFLNTPATSEVSLPGAPLVAGQGLAPVDSAVTYLQYDVLNDGTAVRSITAALTGPLPSGVSLMVRAVAPDGCGTSSSWQQLPPAPASVTIVTGVPTCSTGNGPADGARLQYRLAVSTMASLRAFANVANGVSFAFTAPK